MGCKFGMVMAVLWHELFTAERLVWWALPKGGRLWKRSEWIFISCPINMHTQWKILFFSGCLSSFRGYYFRYESFS